MRTVIVLVAAMVAGAMVGGCQRLTAIEVERAGLLEEAGIDAQSEGTRSPTSVGLANLAFGCGDLLNAQPAQFCANFCTWPISIIWAPWTGAQQAEVMNTRDTVHFYFETEKGRARYEDFCSRP